MNLIRAFIAINLSPEIIRGLDQALSQLKERAPGKTVRWVAAGNIHLTIKFLGDVSVANLEMLKSVIRVEANRHVPFEIRVGNLGAFPSFKRPRVVWVGVEAPSELLALQRAIETETRRLGYPPEERPFSPHLTLGRAARNAAVEGVRRLSESLIDMKVGFLGAVTIQEVHLYRSDLQAGGSIYTRLFTAPLSAANQP
jgi:2'-5' RNA ligase